MILYKTKFLYLFFILASIYFEITLRLIFMQFDTRVSHQEYTMLRVIVFIIIYNFWIFLYFYFFQFIGH